MCWRCKAAAGPTCRQQTPKQRVDDLAPPSYSEGEEMLEVLKRAVRSAAARIAIRARAKGE